MNEIKTGIIGSQKPKLSVIRTSSWQWKLNTRVFGRKIMDPVEMNNMCLYAWLTVAAVFLAIPFALGYYLVIKPFNYLEKIADEYVNNYMDTWVENAPEEQLYDVFENRFVYDNSRVVKRFPKKFMRKDTYKLWKILMKKKGFNSDNEAMEYFIEIQEKRNKLIKKRRERIKITNAKREASEIKREKAISRSLDILEMAFLPFRKLWGWLVKSFTFNSTDRIVKVTKRFIGMLITLLMLTGLYYVVQLFVLIVVAIFEAWNGPVVLEFMINFGTWVLITTAFIASMVYLGKRIEMLAENYRNGNKLTWHGNFFMWLWKVVSGFFIYTFWIPGRFIFEIFLWKFVAVSLIWGAIVSFGNIFRATTGIFGEYFGKGFNDYCPGIEVVDDSK